VSLSIPQMARMSQLLEEGLPLDEAARRLWLEQLPPEHEDLVAALRRSLFPSDAESARIDTLGALPALGASTLRPGTRVGPYELLRRLGAGGMAEVWLARRADGAFKRDVAVKVPMLAQLRADLEQRFARERDIVASLEHPNIARLYDAGVDPAGLPYLSMEYVPGQPLTDYCDTRGLSIAQRLELLLQVLEAVQYAHQRQVIHRDLKPSNILVMEPGQVRLLDFGVAKLLDADTANEMTLTSVYGRALTADYASPELLRGDEVDGRSDIYSLGVLLYELLTGVRPYRLKRAASMGMADQAVAALDIEEPSALLEKESTAGRGGARDIWARQLRGDLDAITFKALAKDPAERYSSAAALSADLRHYLAGEPIQAHAAGVRYRLAKFARRNRAVVAVSATALAAILGSAAYIAYRDRIARVPVVGSAPAIAAAPSASFLGGIRSGRGVGCIRTAGAFGRRAAVSGFQRKEGSGIFLGWLGGGTAGPACQHSRHARHGTHFVLFLQGQVRRYRSHRAQAQCCQHPRRQRAQIRRPHTGGGAPDPQQRRRGDMVRHLRPAAERCVPGAGRDRRRGGRGAESQACPGPTGRQCAPYFEPRSVQRGFTGAAILRSLHARWVSARGRCVSQGDAARPGYAAAYAELAMSEFFAADWSNDAAGRQRALAAADKAVALAPDQAEGYAARGHIRVNGAWDWSGARTDFEKALKLDPSNSIALRRYALLLATLGEVQESIALTKKAIDLDPLSGVTWANLGLLLLGDGQIAAAHDAIYRAVEIQPESSYALNDLLDLQLMEGKFADVPETARRHGGEEFALKSTAMA
jgi:serine/threonine protein kinase/Tfp pilus assembly protein PilF